MVDLTQAVGVIVLTVCLATVGRYCVKMETHDSDFAEKRAGVEWDDLDDPCIAYLNAISQYPHWRICVISTLVSTILFFSAYMITHENVNPRHMGSSIIIYVLLNSFVQLKSIDYFRWHIMCKGDKGWGCTKKYKRKK